MSVLRLSGLREGGNDRIVKMVYIGECSLVGWPMKRWIDTDLDSRRARKMVRDRNDWMGVCEGECLRCIPWDEPLNLRRCHTCELSRLFKALDW